MIRVALVDDQELVRTGFRMVLDAQPDMTVTGEAADGLAAVKLASQAEADVMVMDVRMPRLDGVEAARRICQADQRPRVLMLTTFDLDEYAFAALKAGASGFLLKDVPPQELLFAIRSVHSGDSVVAPSTTRRLIDACVPLLSAGQAPAPPADLADLTEREREVLVQVAAGLSNAEIAARLFVSEATVKTHVGRILAKLGLRDRVQAVVLAYESGLVRARARLAGGPVQRPGERREHAQRQQPPGVDAGDVGRDGGERERGDDDRGDLPVVADHEIVGERAERLDPVH
jgi:DNA-binding NarL/FixJ family response regulator